MSLSPLISKLRIALNQKQAIPICSYRDLVNHIYYFFSLADNIAKIELNEIKHCLYQIEPENFNNIDFYKRPYALQLQSITRIIQNLITNLTNPLLLKIMYNQLKQINACFYDIFDNYGQHDCSFFGSNYFNQLIQLSRSLIMQDFNDMEDRNRCIFYFPDISKYRTIRLFKELS